MSRSVALQTEAVFGEGHGSVFWSGATTYGGAWNTVPKPLFISGVVSGELEAVDVDILGEFVRDGQVDVDTSERIAE